MIRHAPLLLVFAITLISPAHAQLLAEPVPMRLVFQSGDYFSADEAIYTVWRSEEEREAFMLDRPHGNLHGPAYDVDYTREMALVVALGARGNGNALVSVDAVLDAGDRLVVYSTEYEPCGGTRPIINPAVVMAVPRDARPIEFLPTRVVPFAHCR